MKKILLTLLAFFCGMTTLYAQELIIAADEKDASSSQIQLSEQLPFQQLIGYAIEVSSVALTDKKPVGRYYCDSIYLMEGYDELSKHPCELIIHSKKGPIVVRYKNVSAEMNEDIKTFLSENQMGTSLYYNNGRFRFSLEDEEEEQETEPESEALQAQ